LAEGLSFMSWDSSVSIVTSLQVDSKLGQKFSFCQYHRDWLQGSPSLLSIYYWPFPWAWSSWGVKLTSPMW